MNKTLLYPIKFTPILQEKIWGGKKLKSEFNKKSDSDKIGESWELSGVNDFISIVSNGDLKGKSLTQLIKDFKYDFVGQKVYKQFGEEFPLLFKFIDAADDLSIQLHPNDELAKKRHNSFGKTEMWYVMSAEKDALLYAGFNKQLNKESYLKEFEAGNILEIVQKETVEAGDSFFIEVGTIHAIGKGLLIAEIQQTSNITYRVYDWDRTDASGKGRELHTDLALDALDFSKIGSCKLKYNQKINQPNEIYSCQYFTTNKIFIENPLQREVSHIDSFVVYMCVKGEVEFKINNNFEILRSGETVLIPAKVESLTIKPNINSELLEVYIK